MATSPLPCDTFLYEKADALHGFSVLATEIPVKGCLTVCPGLYPIPVSSLSFYRQYAEQITRAMKDYGISKAVLRRHDLYMANEPGVYEGPPYLLRISWRRLDNGEMTVEEHMAYYEAQGMDSKSAMKQVAKDRGVGKREIYAQIHGGE